ncbi:hypothetical protein BDA99DRAFT_527657 [Phascolomyces articulosus]|uniref:Uncharacterized protein n=1 Tax=Phascolomyces articulosus TaxID=60185 RepID=A0AAD5JXU6_9FUNG|nr:hypothetical protein BDA99DRAFT_527657 [Phascolomyces articulosus]
MTTTSPISSITPSQFSIAHWETIKYKPALGAHELFAKFAGISTGSAGKAIQICKTDEKKVISSKLGWPKKEILRQEYNLVREYISERNAKDIIPAYSKYQISNSNKKYLEKRIGNLNDYNMSIIPEVFLDESFVHLDHHSKQTWFETGMDMRESGRKPMFVIFGAFIAFRQDNRMIFELVLKNL